MLVAPWNLGEAAAVGTPRPGTRCETEILHSEALGQEYVCRAMVDQIQHKLILPSGT
jgi:hypothetical protein